MLQVPYFVVDSFGYCSCYFTEEVIQDIMALSECESAGLVFSAVYLQGIVALAHSRFRRGTVPLTDKPRKDCTLPPVTSEKPCSSSDIGQCKPGKES